MDLFEALQQPRVGQGDIKDAFAKSAPQGWQSLTCQLLLQVV
jgi:hypothetical protein